ncbi:MAG: hypothetical protein R2794_10835 [Chitinophagales bacterium]
MSGPENKIKPFLSDKAIFIRVFAICCLATLSGSVYSQMDQLSEADRKTERRTLLYDLFWGAGETGIYCGTSNHWEYGAFGSGAEIKRYDSYYGVPFISDAIYVSYRHHFIPEHIDMPQNSFALGVQFSLIGVEAAFVFQGDAMIIQCIPKAGIDFGNASIFYSYAIPINHGDVFTANQNAITLKYDLFLTAFRFHKMRLENHYYDRGR